ncbi:hypothetical protein HDU93_001762 [Gonapodya sp. JEL0774]|nr:hypothetical protein HDU93_001762 [Gonapodya sp. JEL0774]
MECQRNPPDRPVIVAIIDCCGKQWHQSTIPYRFRLSHKWKRPLDCLMYSWGCWDILPLFFSAEVIIPDQVKCYITHEIVLSPKGEDVLKAILSVIRINHPVGFEDPKRLWRGLWCGLEFSCLYENKYIGAAELILDAMLERHGSLSDFSFRDSMFDIFASLAKDYAVYRERVVLNRSLSLKDRKMFKKHHDSFPTFTHLFLTRNVIHARQRIQIFPLNRIVSRNPYTSDTILDLACRSGHVEVVRLLLDSDSGATPSELGRSFIAAVSRGCIEVVELLLSRGVVVTEPMAGTSPLQLVIRSRRHGYPSLQMLRILLSNVDPSSAESVERVLEMVDVSWGAPAVWMEVQRRRWKGVGSATQNVDWKSRVLGQSRGRSCVLNDEVDFLWRSSDEILRRGSGLAQ